MSFVHLQVKSSYSFLQSTINIKEYVRYIKSLGLSTCAITDHQVLHGAYEFYQICKQEEVKPVIGMSVDVYLNQEQRPLTFYLYAKDFKGYQSLVNLSNLIQLEKERVTLKHILQSEQVIPVVSFYDTFVEELIYLDDQHKLNEIVDTFNQLQHFMLKSILLLHLKI